MTTCRTTPRVFRSTLAAVVATLGLSLGQAAPAAGTVPGGNGALAMVHYARAKRVLGDPDAAKTTAAEAVRLLEQRRAAGDDSESVIVALALAYSTQSQIQEFLNDPNVLSNSLHAISLLKPLVQTANPSVTARRAYVEVLVRVGFEQLRSGRFEEAAHSLQLSTRYASELGAHDLSDFGMAAYFAEADSEDFGFGLW